MSLRDDLRKEQERQQAGDVYMSPNAAKQYDALATPTQPKPVQTTNPTNPSLTDLYNKQRALYQQQYDAQRQIANRNALQQRQSLQQQLKSQREDYIRGQQLAVRDNFQRGRNLLNNLTNRGLATSGLVQLGDVQNRIATGETLSQLAAANAQVQKAGMDAEQTIGNTLQDSLYQIGNNYQSNMLNADLGQYEQQQVSADKSLQSLLSLLEASGGDLDENVLGTIKEAYQAYVNGDSSKLNSLLNTVEQPATMGEIVGDQSYSSGYFDKKRVFKNNLLNDISNFGMKYGPVSPLYFAAQEAGLTGVHFKTQDGTELLYKNWDSALAAIKERYESFPDSHLIDIVKDGKRIKFKSPDGQSFNTYNQALQHIKDYRLDKPKETSKD